MKDSIPDRTSVGGTCNGSPYEQVLGEDGKPTFLVYRTKDVNRLLERQFEKTGDYKLYFYLYPSVKDEETGITYVPKKRVAWLLTDTLPEKRLTHEELWLKIKTFLRDHLDLVDERQYDVITAWIVATYSLEKWTSVPYLSFSGPVKSGKTRAQECLQHLSYRGVLVANISTAALYRLLDNYHPTMLLDETEVYSTEQRSDILGVLNCGYRRGQYVIRANVDSMKEDIYYNVFGFKSLSGTKGFINTLTSRCIIINMYKATRDINFFLDSETAKEIRMHLLLMRLEQFDTYDTYDTYDTLLGKAQALLNELPNADGRMLEKYYPLLDVANCGRPAIIDYANNAIEIEGYADESTIEAEVTRTLVNCKDKVYKGVLKAKEIKAEFNSDKEQGEKWTTRSITNVVRRLGLFQKRAVDGQRGYIYNTKKIEGLCLRYAISMTPETITAPLDVSFMSDVSNASSLPGKILDNVDEKHCTKCNEIPDKLYPDKEGSFYICKSCKLLERGDNS